MKNTSLFIVAILFLCVCQSSQAEVKTVSDDYFNLHIEVELSDRNQIAYSKFLKVGQWWDPEHTFFGKSRNLRIESKAGGCFCERTSNRSVKHMSVTHADPGFLLRMRGGLGPLQALPVDGVMTYTFKQLDGKTLLILDYEVWGAKSAKLTEVAAAVDSVLIHQLIRLQRFIDTGSADIK